MFYILIKSIKNSFGTRTPSSNTANMKSAIGYDPESIPSTSHPRNYFLQDT
jgi:hypothetical protein